jgi:hypothetical protein
VIYKIIAKCLINRLRPYLQELISETQSAFIPGRLISDNALIAFECFHAIHRARKGDDQFCAYKLDLTKAYDRVDWEFLEGALIRFGFDRKWVNLVMSCVKSVKFTVQINGQLTKEIIPTRGLRQGDPLSPYMFLFVAECFSKILVRAIQNHDLKEFKISRTAPGISHLMFADDCILFFQANGSQARVIKSALATFEKGSGQLLSVSKCSILFSDQCSQISQNSVRQIMEVHREEFEDKYLGLPTPDGRMKKGKFQPYKDPLGKKLTNWAERYMSMGAKDELIKSVVQAIPIHVMSVFKLPVGFHEDYMRIVRNFWWGEDENKRKVHWAAWDILTDPKELGGVGFRDTRIMNQALLARQCWRILTKPSSMCSRLLKSIYFPRGNFLDTVFRQDASPSWQGIEHGRQLLKEGLIWRIGNGDKVDIWRDSWIPRDYNLKVSPGKSNSRLRRVKQLLLPQSNQWNEEVVKRVCFPRDADWILNLKLPKEKCDDFFAWHYEKTGIFSVKSAYRLAYNLNHGVMWRAGSSSRPDNTRLSWKTIWNAKVPSKVKIFGWRAACDNLPTKKNKFRRTLETDSTCSICGRVEENSHHAIVDCSKPRALRYAMRSYWDLPGEYDFLYSGPDWLQALLTKCNLKQRDRVLLLLWRSWHLRCNITHGKGEETIANSVAFLQSYCDIVHNEVDNVKKKGNRSDDYLSKLMMLVSDGCYKGEC